MISLLATVVSFSQYKRSELDPPPPPPSMYLDNTAIPDSDFLPSPVSPTLPRGLEDYAGREYAADLATPSNIKTEAVYDPDLRMYVLHTKLGDSDIITPYMMTPEQYNEMVTRREMYGYFQERNSVTEQQKEKQPFNILDMNFSLGPLEKVFGPGGARPKALFSFRWASRATRQTIRHSRLNQDARHISTSTRKFRPPSVHP